MKILVKFGWYFKLITVESYNDHHMKISIKIHVEIQVIFQIDSTSSIPRGNQRDIQVVFLINSCGILREATRGNTDGILKEFYVDYYMKLKWYFESIHVESLV